MHAALAVSPPDAPLDARELSRLKWHCRRGLLENDLFLERFFRRFESSLTVGQAQALRRLMDLSDNDLLDLNLGRKSPAQVEASLDTPAVAQILAMLRATPPKEGRYETR